MLTHSEVHSYFNDNMELVLQNYSIKDGLYVLNEEDVNMLELEKYLRSISQILVIDNGSGMNSKVDHFVKTNFLKF